MKTIVLRSLTLFATFAALGFVVVTMLRGL